MLDILYEYNNIFLLHKVKKQLKIKFNTNKIKKPNKQEKIK